MTNEELKELLREIALDGADDMIILEGDEFADGAVGISYGNHVVYDYQKLIESLSKHNNWTEEEAMEWLDYNTLRALPYMKADGKEPIIMIDRFSDYLGEGN